MDSLKQNSIEEEEKRRKINWIKIQLSLIENTNSKIVFSETVVENIFSCIHKLIWEKPNKIITTKYNIDLFRSEFELLNWEQPQCINDKIINIYMGLINERSKNNDMLPKTHAFQTFFMTKLINGQNERLNTETKNINIFNYEYLIFPVHRLNHWTLMFANMTKKEIKFYDPLGKSCEGLKIKLREYLSNKHMELYGTTLTGWKFENKTGPLQENNKDCGIFIMTFAEILSSNRQPSVFGQRNIKNFRQKIMHELYEKKLLETEVRIYCLTTVNVDELFP